MFLLTNLSLKYLILSLVFSLVWALSFSTYAMDPIEQKAPRSKQTQITDFFTRQHSEKKGRLPSTTSQPSVIKAAPTPVKRPLPEDSTIVSPPFKVSKTTVSSSPRSTAILKQSIAPESIRSIPTQSKKIPVQIPFQPIVGEENHITELVSLIRSAKQKLEIFSWTLGYLPSRIFDSLREAADKGVNIILTVQDVKREETLEALEDANIQVNADRKTHTKFVMVDDHTAMVGSYNYLAWQNDDNEEEDEQEESSCKIISHSDLVTRIRGRIYRDMIAYERKETPLTRHLSVDLAEDSKFFLLTNLLHHNEFFKCAVQNAQNKIVIYSPFVNNRNALARLKMIEEKVGANVSLIVHTRPAYTAQLKGALAQVPKLKGKFKIIESEFHRKSLVVDPQSNTCQFCDGSFNWFSAATDLESEACNQETSIVLSGLMARRYLQASGIND